MAVDPRRARITLRAYTEEWLSRRTDLAERTHELYTWLATTKLYPTLGDVPLGELSPSTVRAWNATLAQWVPSTAAKAYRLLRVILGTAMSDEIITRNPCQVKGAGSETAAERPVVSVS